MSAGYEKVIALNANATTTASEGILVGPIDIKNFARFSVLYQNNHTAIGFVNMAAQVAANPAGSAADAPPNWVTLSTATLEVPSALGATASFRSSLVNNAYGYLRIIGGTCATASANTLRITVEGFNSF